MKLTDGAISVLTTALSILAGLLFNLLVLLHTLQLPKQGEPLDSKIQRLLQELHANIAYSIVVSLLTLAPLVIASYCGLNDPRRSLLGHVSAYLVVHLVLTMGMVLKRMDTMLQQRMPKQERNTAGASSMLLPYVSSMSQSSPSTQRRADSFR